MRLFSQIDGAVKSIQGTGLGLFLVYRNGGRGRGTFVTNFAFLGWSCTCGFLKNLI